MEDSGRLRLLLTAARCVLAAIRSCPADGSLPAQHRNILVHTIQSLQLLEGYLEYVAPAGPPSAASASPAAVSGTASQGSTRLALPRGDVAVAMQLLRLVPTPAAEERFPPEPMPLANEAAFEFTFPIDPPQDEGMQQGYGEQTLAPPQETDQPAPAALGLSACTREQAPEDGSRTPLAGTQEGDGAAFKKRRGRSRSPLWVAPDLPLQPPHQQESGPATPVAREARSETRARVSKWDQAPQPASPGQGRQFDEPGEALGVLLGDATDDAAIIEVQDCGYSENEAELRSKHDGPLGDEDDEDMPQHLVGLSKKVSSVLRYGGKRGRLKKEMCGEGWMPREVLFEALSRQNPHELDAVLTDRRYETRSAAGRTYHRAARRPRHSEGPGPGKPPAGRSTATSSTAAHGSSQWQQRSRHR